MSRPRIVLRAMWHSTAWLAVGLVITVAVSWGLAAWMPQRGWKESFVNGWESKDAILRMGIRVFEVPGCVRRTWALGDAKYVFLYKAAIDMPEWDEARKRAVGSDQTLGWPQWGVAETALDWYRPQRNTPGKLLPGRWDAYDGLEHATGWPMLALWYELELGRGPVGRKSPPMAVGGIAFPSNAVPLHSCRALPYLPIYPGLAIDTAFWGATAFAVVAGIRATRAALRRRRGQCLACAYDLKGDTASGCPECGWNRPTIQTQATT